ncbi:MAG: hypothetical protein WBL79_00515 [Bacillota bacterium]|jgi:hypothetical protein|nr:hypothetical protein [Bacillota bacterium]HOK71865.1 hypothetical protein [Bacillota bacterium]HOO30444.1 hypothetical protein [Bacillota bacterium]HQD80634.1 hypothetical protein [Bacillota bacterium]
MAALLMIGSVIAVVILVVVLWFKRSADMSDAQWRHAAIARGFLLVCGIAYLLIVIKTTTCTLREIFRVWPK